jgi:endonuclease IV
MDLNPLENDGMEAKRKKKWASRPTLPYNSLQSQQLTTLKIHDGSYVNFNEKRNSKVEETFSSILQCFEHLQILDISYTNYGASCMLNLGPTCKPKIR